MTVSDDVFKSANANVPLGPAVRAQQPPAPQRMTQEQVDEWIRQEMANAPKEEIEDLQKKEEILKMLAQPELHEYGTYLFGEVEIRYRKYMTKGLRSLLSKAQREVKVSTDPISTQDDLVFKALAQICVDDPWNSPYAWQLVDLRSNDGRVYKIFMDLVAKIGGTENSLKTFR
jgi:hypothetical protein